MSTPFKIYYFEDLSVGMRETLMKAVMDDDVIAFADLSGDRNPIHLSDHFASKTRFGERIVHGLYTASLISTVIGMYLPGPGAVYLSQTLNFRAPVKIGDVITVVVEVVELIEKGRRAKLKCECLVDGKVVLDGEAFVMVPSREQAVARRGARAGGGEAGFGVTRGLRRVPSLHRRARPGDPAAGAGGRRRRAWQFRRAASGPSRRRRPRPGAGEKAEAPLRSADIRAAPRRCLRRSVGDLPPDAA